MAVVAVSAVAASLSVGAVAANAASAAMPYDFDGDGDPALVVGAPGMRINGHAGAGAAVVLPASSRGLSLAEMLISQASPGVLGSPEANDGFGSSVESADFNRDGYADLAVGVPLESIGRREEAGAVTVMYGSARGLDTSRSVLITRPAGPATGVQWGSSLVAGDFNVDGYPDLAVGAPRANSVEVLPGSANGLGTTGARVLGPQDGTAEGFIQFGAVLAAGDLDGDGDTDLVVGARGEDPHEEFFLNGSVSYCTGKAGGPTACTRLVRGDDYAGLSGVAVGKMSGGVLPEIAVGVPDMGLPEPNDFGAGRVHFLQLSAGRSITVARHDTIMQSSAGVPGSDEGGDRFGTSIAVRDLDSDGYADLVVGAPGENVDRGRVTVIHGASTGWRTSGNCSYSQSTPGVPGVAEEFDRLGWALTLLDHDRDGHLDLTVSAPEENSSGAITTLRGSSGCGFTTDGSRTFGLAKLGYDNQPGAAFGSVLGQR
jgi:hypothetical protein